MTTVEIPIPALLVHQAPDGLHPARFKVLRWGRRRGKDRFALNVSIVGHGPLDPQGQPAWPGIAQGWDVCWLARDYKQANAIWVEEFVPRFKPAGDLAILNQNDMCVGFPGSGTLWLRSNENVDSIRGIGKRIKGVVINEAAHFDLEYAWRSVVRPILVDNVGWAVIMSTTNSGQDGNVERIVPSFFNRLCAEIEGGHRGPDWHTSYGTAFDNPELDPVEVQALVQEYPPESIALQEEVYAKLLVGGAGVAFPEWREDLHVVPVGKLPADWRAAAALDWGWRKGWFGIAGLGPEGEVSILEELVLTELYAEQMGYRCALMAGKYPLEYCAADEQMWKPTGIGPTLFEEFARGWARAYREGQAPPIIEASHGRGSIAVRTQLLHRYLSWVANADGVVEPWNRPRLTMASPCRDAIARFAGIGIDPRHPDVYDTDADDHAVDAIGYLLQSRPPLAERIKAPRDPDAHPGFTRTGQRRKPWEESLRRGERPGIVLEEVHDV